MTNHPNRRTMYTYAVMDGNEAPDQYRYAYSCHNTIGAARSARDSANRRDPNYHYYLVEWNATRWARARPNDAHYGAIA